MFFTRDLQLPKQLLFMLESKYSNARRRRSLSMNEDFGNRFRVEVEFLGSDANDESAVSTTQPSAYTNFTWTLQSFTPGSISMQLTFGQPEVYARGFQEQFLHVYADFSDFEPEWDSERPLLTKRIPK